MDKRPVLELKERSRVVFAKPEDIPQITALAVKYVQDHINVNIPVELDTLLPFITESVLAECALIKKCKKDKKTIEGVLVLTKQKVWWNSSTTFLKDIFFYIKPEVRGLRVLIPFIKALKEIQQDFDKDILVSFDSLVQGNDKFVNILSKRYNFTFFNETKVLKV